MATKLETRFNTELPAGLSEDTVRKCEVLGILANVKYYPPDSTQLLVDNLIDLHLTVESEMQAFQHLSPTEQYRQREIVRKYYSDEPQFRKYKEAFAEKVADSYGRSESFGKRLGAYSRAIEFADTLETTVTHTIDTLLKDAKKHWDQNMSQEYSSVVGLLHTLGPVVVPEITAPQSSAQSRTDATSSKEPFSFSVQKSTVQKAVVGFALSATVLVSTTIPASAAEKPSAAPNGSGNSSISQPAEVSPVGGVDTTPAPNPAVSNTVDSTTQPSDTTPSSPSSVDATPSTPPASDISTTPSTQAHQSEVTPAPVDITGNVSSKFTQTPALSQDTPIFNAMSTLTQDQQTQDPGNAADTNEPLSSVLERLDPTFSDTIVKLHTVLKSHNLTGFSPGEGDFNPADPADHSKKLEIMVSPKVREALKVHYDDINAILAGDDATIKRLLTYYASLPPLDSTYANTIGAYVSSADFVKSGDALTIEQRMLLIREVGQSHDELRAEAIRITIEAQAAYDKAHPAKPTPEIVPSAGITDTLIDAVAQKHGWSPDKVVMLKALVKLGVSLPAAAGMMGNAKVESAGYHPGIQEFGNNIGFGYFQWSFGRRKALEAAAKDQGISPSDPVFQIQYAINESKNRSQRDDSSLNEWDGLLNMQDPQVAAAYWQWNFERPSAKHPQSGRTKEAQKVFDQINAELGNQTVRPSTIRDLPKDVGNRYTTEAIINAAQPGESMFGLSDPCSSVIGNVRALCVAEKFFNVRYGTNDPAYADRWARRWGVDKITSSGGHNPKHWILHNVPSSSNDFIECSGFVAVAFAGAFNNPSVDTCSAGFLSDSKNFKEINPHDIRPGDLLIASRHCGGNNGGHVAIVKSYNKDTGVLITYESSAGLNIHGEKKSGEYHGRQIGVDFHFAARYVGVGSTADVTNQ